MFDHQSAALKLLHQSFEQSGAKLGQFVAGDRLPLDDAVSIEVLHPPVAGMNGSDNAKSIVLSIEHLGKRILLAGDLESPGLEALMNKPRLDADILLAPHHGSARSDPPGFAAWSAPEFVVVSGGRNDDSATVRKAYEMRGATVINTARRGAVTAIISKEGLTVQTFRNPEK
jgi:competence protein ComEC